MGREGRGQGEMRIQRCPQSVDGQIGGGERGGGEGGRAGRRGMQVVDARLVQAPLDSPSFLPNPPKRTFLLPTLVNVWPERAPGWLPVLSSASSQVTDMMLSLPVGSVRPYASNQLVSKLKQPRPSPVAKLLKQVPGFPPSVRRPGSSSRPPNHPARLLLARDRQREQVLQEHALYYENAFKHSASRQALTDAILDEY